MPMQLPKKYLPFIIAGIAGIIAVFLINSYVQQQADMARQRETEKQKRLTTVVIAKKDIASGATLDEKSVKEETIRKDLLQPSAATSISRVEGLVTIAPIAKGEQVQLNKLSSSGREMSLSAKVPKDKRAFTIPVDNISSVGGMIRPSDHVDILGMVPIPTMGADGKQMMMMSTVPLFQDVLVLAVGQEFATVTGAEKAEKKISSNITLALAPEEVNILAFVQEQGKIRLVLRSPQDTSKQPPEPASWQTVLPKIIPGYFQKPQAEQRNTVEIIRGQAREIRELR